MPINRTASFAAAAALAATAVALPFLTPATPSAVAAPKAAEVATQAATYSFDSVHSCALFRVLHLQAGQFYGRFNTIEGSFEFDADSAAPPSFDVAIPIESVDTNNESLDRHLRSADFFNAVEHPNMTFKSRSGEQVGDKKYKVAGDLTILGVTKPVTAEVEWTGSYDGPRGFRSGFEAVFTIDRTAFGMRYGIDNGSLGSEVKVIVSMEGVRN